MAYYCVNKNAQSNGDHEVHLTSCGHAPDLSNRLSLGNHDSCSSAVREAKKTYPTADGCYYCSYACHKR